MAAGDSGKALAAGLKRWTPGEPIPEYVGVGLEEPQQEVGVWLHGLGSALDVTHRHVIVSLRPLTVGVSLEQPLADEAVRLRRAELVLAERGPEGRVMGRVRLQYSRALRAGSAPLCLFETRGHANHCLPLIALWRFYLARWRRSRGQPFNFKMRTAELHRQYVLYICPRPVLLVSVVHGPAGNLFPMDLIGPACGDGFVLALRSTSPAVRLMAESGRMALSSPPPELAPRVYDLGRHHRLASIDWDALPFAVRPSPRLSLPMPEPARAVREVEVDEVHPVGSHTVFVTRVVNSQRLSDGPCLFHISGLYQAYLSGRRRPL